MPKIQFSEPFVYTDRATKQQYVAQKYAEILKGKVLDVGADQQYLKQFLPADVQYTGIDIGGAPEVIKVDLEKDRVPFEDNEFDCIVCLDVLEHIENIHDVFDELCRVTKEWVIISLPNPWTSMMSAISDKPYKEGRNTKFYGLPLERESDRHKWFFSSSEAQAFINYRAQKNGMELYDLYIENKGSDGLAGLPEDKRNAVIAARELIFRPGLNIADLYESTQWYVLRKLP